MDKKQIILIGGGGHCKSCIDVIEQTGQYEIAGIIDLPHKLGQRTSGYEVIGNDADIERFASQGFCFVITMGQVKSAAPRKRLFEHLKQIDAAIESIISPRAYLAKGVTIGEGSIVMHGVHVIESVKIGANCILNTACTVEHDAVVGNHCHISTHAIVNGECAVGDECFIGSNSVISNQISVASQCVIGAGSVVAKNIYEQGTYVGNPARKIL